MILNFEDQSCLSLLGVKVVSPVGFIRLQSFLLDTLSPFEIAINCSIFILI